MKARSSNQRCFIRKAARKTFCNFQRKTPVSKSLFNKVAGLQACCNFIKKWLQHSFFFFFFFFFFFCEYCEIFKNAYFEEYQRTAASGRPQFFFHHKLLYSSVIGKIELRDSNCSFESSYNVWLDRNHILSSVNIGIN